MRLIEPPGFMAGGAIRFAGRDITGISEREFRTISGRDICLVFQDPMSALNPVYTVGAQVVEAIRAHQDLSRSAAMERAVELFRIVGIPAPERRVHDFPHRLSGGMRQRVTIAMALANEPQLLILDEPTTALDATIQAQILDLVQELRQRANTAVLLITHDIGVVREMCEQVVVMYGGRVMERGTVAQVTEDPKHPYTGPAVLDAGHARCVAGGWNHRGRGSQSAAHAAGLPVRSPLPAGDGRVRDDARARDPGDGRSVACWLY